MADEKDKEKTEAVGEFLRAFTERNADIRKFLDSYATAGEQTRKWAEDLTKHAASKVNALNAATLGVGKQVAEIAEWMKSLDEVLRLTKEGKLGAYSDDTPVPELMERMRRLKEAQKTALETGQVDLAAANEWLISRWPAHRPCPLCNHEEWAIGPSFTQIPTSTPGLQKPPRINPCVAVVCGHCGNTILLNAIIMGLLQSEG
ncbi:hypothetical protein [Candidatus Binatus sp.]|uniref:hypothetical protein n=1 Tax=Candidatus Binatus sp. TaxID=2811406 RepID=UPI002F94FBC4